jgi:hypothetical protein
LVCRASTVDVARGKISGEILHILVRQIIGGARHQMMERATAAMFLAKQPQLTCQIGRALAGEAGIKRVSIRLLVTAEAGRDAVFRTTGARKLFPILDISAIRIFLVRRKRLAGHGGIGGREGCHLIGTQAVDGRLHDTACPVALGMR